MWNGFSLDYFKWRDGELCVKWGDRASVMWEILAPVQTIKAHSHFWMEHEASVLMVCASFWPLGTRWDSVAKSFSGTFCSNYFCSAAFKRQEQLGWKFDVLGYVRACDLGFCWLTVPTNDKWGSGWKNVQVLQKQWQTGYLKIYMPVFFKYFFFTYKPQVCFL